MMMKWRRRLSIGFIASVSACAIISPALPLVGPASEDQSFASHVVMVLKRGGGQAGFCTGIVVASQIVLTAAHCAAPIKDLRIYYKDAAGGPAILEVSAIAIHPGYRADALSKHVASIDLAMVRTQTPLDARFSAAALDEAGDVAVGQSVKIFGYGVAQEGEGKSGGVLRSAKLRVRAPLSSVLLWAEDPDGAGAGGCSGDSGGPILSGDGAKVLAVTTWSAGSAAGRHCGAVTQGPLIAPQRAWIDSVLDKWRH
jgi:secreted trypsin-like serine protease